MIAEYWKKSWQPFRKLLLFASISSIFLLFAMGLNEDGSTERFGRAAAPQGLNFGFHVAQGDAQHLDAAQSAGADFVVLVFKWGDIEPVPGYFYWEVPDAALRAAEYHGLELIARIDHPPAWALDPSSPTPWDLDAYADFASTVANRYGDRLSAIIIGNEPNLALEWNGQTPDSDGYVALLRSLYPAIKEVEPNLPIAMAGLAFTEGDSQNQNDLDYLSEIYAAEGHDFFDVVAAHPYGFGRPPTEPPDNNRLNFRRMERYRAIMAEFGDEETPIWITEMGWRTSAPNPADRWQVVTPEQQVEYVQQALNYAIDHRDWLHRLALWQLRRDGDEYGYDLWNGPTDASPAYNRLVSMCALGEEPFGPTCENQTQDGLSDATTIEILAADTTVRLGDIATLHPHWVHLYKGGTDFSPRWRGEFFVDDADGVYDLVLETMQVDQAANRIGINDEAVATLLPRSRPDPTSTWVTQRFPLSSGVLRNGVNQIEVSVSLRNPAWQYADWRWENLQIRNVRLVPKMDEAQDSPLDWQPVASPGSWGEPIRLRAGLHNDFWLMTNRRGGLWLGRMDPEPFVTRVAGTDEWLFTDILPTTEGELAATDQGLLWRAHNDRRWHPVVNGLHRYAYVVEEGDSAYWAGFEDGGIWQSESAIGPWRLDGLDQQTIFDLVYNVENGHLYAATSSGPTVRNSDGQWRSLPAFPEEQSTFVNRLFLLADGTLVVRTTDTLWQLSADELSWSAFGPANVKHQYATINCCAAGPHVATNEGLWRYDLNDVWQQLDEDETLKTVDGRLIGLIEVGDHLLAASDSGLLASRDGGTNWQVINGLNSIVSDVLLSTEAGDQWFAGTSSGVYQSEDKGQTWTRQSRPWDVQELALGDNGRIYVATARGIWSGMPTDDSVDWQPAQGMERVRFFTVVPDPDLEEQVWAGTWGNDIALSEDSGRSLSALGNGLETLSVLSILHHKTSSVITVATIEGIYQSQNRGQSWNHLSGPLAAQTVYHLHEDNDGQLWAAAADGLWHSSDQGVTWQQQMALGQKTVVRLGSISLPDGKEMLWAGTEREGLSFTVDGGRRWLNGGLENKSVYRLVADGEGAMGLIAAADDGLYHAEISDMLR